MILSLFTHWQLGLNGVHEVTTHNEYLNCYTNILKLVCISSRQQKQLLKQLLIKSI